MLVSRRHGDWCIACQSWLFERCFLSAVYLFMFSYFLEEEKKQLHRQGSRFDFVWYHPCAQRAEFYEQRELFCLIESTLFIQRKKDSVSLVKFEARSLTAVLADSLLLDFSFRGCFFSHTASCEKDVEQFYRPHQVRVIHSANLLTSGEHFYYTRYPWDRLKYHGTSCQKKQIKSSESQIFQGTHINIFRMHSCMFCFTSSKSHSLLSSGTYIHLTG